MENEVMSGWQTESAPAANTQTERSEFTALLERDFKPSSDQARDAVESAVRTLATQALSDTQLIAGDSLSTIEAIIAAIDRKLTEQANQIIHEPSFQALESAWRGLEHLVTNTETDEWLKIRVLNISKKELSRTLRRYKGVAWDQSPLFKKIYEAEYGQIGGQPYGVLIGDYYFDHSPPDVELLGGMAQIAAASHAPFIAAAAPSVMRMEGWQELANPRDLTKIFQTPEYAAWRSLRESEDSRYIALAMPRTLGRLPYGAKTSPIDEFDFEENVDGSDASKYLWTNAAYAMGVNLTRSFKLYGWLSRIRGVESGGLVEGLPTHTFPTDDGGVDMKCPTEIAISDRREAELSKNGFLPLVHRKNSDLAVFLGSQTLNKPVRYEDSDATANAELSARLPYMFSTCRFAHYLKCMVRDWVGGNREAPQLQRDLTTWISNYIDGAPETSSEETKARLPLKDAKIEIVPDEENPGFYKGKFLFVPHHQLEGMDIAMSMVSRLPKGA
jgi:type VI secretion system protein ImpC